MQRMNNLPCSGKDGVQRIPNLSRTGKRDMQDMQKYVVPRENGHAEHANYAVHRKI